MRQLKNSVLRFSSYEEMQEYVNANKGFHLEGKQTGQTEFLANPIIDIEIQQITQNEQTIIPNETSGA